jgi:hypothetical protein
MTGFPEDVWKEISDEWLLEVIEAAQHCAKPIVRGYTPMKEAQIDQILSKRKRIIRVNTS